MAETTAAPPKPSSSVKLVLLGEAAVGKVWLSCASRIPPSWKSSPMLTHRPVSVFPRAPLREQ